MRPTLAHSARLLGEPDAGARTRGANLSYEICLARCVAPITPLAPVHVALGRDYVYLAPVLRRIGRALRVAPVDKDAVDLVIAASRALAAISALLVFAQRCDVDVSALSHIAAPLRSRCAPALVVPLLATDLRVVGAARDALDQIVLLRVAHQTPWLDVLLALRSFRSHYTSTAAAAAAASLPDGEICAADPDHQQSLLTVVLTRVSSLLRVVFVDIANRAEIKVAHDAPPADDAPRSPSALRRRSSISAHQQAPPVRVSAMSSWHANLPALEEGLSQPSNRPKRFLDKIRRSRRWRNIPNGTTQSTRCEDGGINCSGCRFCSPSDPESFGNSVAGMRFSNRMKRQESSTIMDRNSNATVGRVSLDSTRNVRRKSLDNVLPHRGRRDSLNGERVNRKSSQAAGRRKRLSLVGNAHVDASDSFSDEAVQPCEWQGEQLGVKNRDIAAAMHIYERLLSRVLLPSMQDRCQVIDDLHRLAHPLLTGVTAGQSHVDAAALRCTVANAFLTHGPEIYPALLALVFRPAPSPERTEEVKRHMSLQPKLATGSENVNQHKSRRYRTTDISEHVMGSMNSLIGKDGFKTEKNVHASQSTVCLPNSDCDTDTAMRCSALLTLLVRNVPNLCNPRLPLMTGTTNSAYWHCAEALVEEDNDENASVSWSVERLVGAVDSLFLLIASLPESPEAAVQVVTQDTVELDNVVETCMRSVCASGCRLARIDARPSAPSLSDTGVIESARAWVALSKLPSQSVLWPSGPAYSSAIVFVAHLARRTALSVYKKRRLQELEQSWQQRNVGHGTPISPVVLVNEDGDPELSAFDHGHGNTRNGNASSRFSSAHYSVLSTATEGQEGNESAMIDRLQECIGILVNRNGSSVVVHDLFRTLLYILGCELRGAPTREAVLTTSNVTVHANENIIAGPSFKESRLPARAPMFTRAAHSPPSQQVRHSFSLSSRVPRVNRELGGVGSGGEIQGVKIQSRATRVSLEENDMSGLLVGNIAVDGSRDNKLRDVAAKAEAAVVAKWFAGVSPPLPPLHPQNGIIGSSARTTPERFMRSKLDIMNPSFPILCTGAGVCDPGCTQPPDFPVAAMTAQFSSRGEEVSPELFEELCIAIALTLNSISTAAATEGEDLSVAMDIVAEDVQRANSNMVTQMHRRALKLLKQSKVGTPNSVWNPTALVRQVRDLQAEVECLRGDVEVLKAALGNVDENLRRFRWPLRSFPRSVTEVPIGTTEVVS